MFAAKNELFTRPSGGYNLTRSLRFRSSASARLNRTPATASNRKTWTWSGWVKRGTLGVANRLFAADDGSASTDQDYNTLLFNSSNQLQFSGNLTDFRTTTAVYRDPAAWYHIVFACDTTQATAANRFRLYVNGVEVTAFSTSNNPTQNTDLAVNSSIAHYIGSIDPSFSSGSYLDGYLTEVQLIDGQALAPTAFGTVNSYGVWQPITYGGSYGTNGFRLPFTNNASTTTLGYDFSPQGNNWTTNNISVTAGSTYDSMTDVPTLTSATAANYCVLNPLSSSSSMTITGGNLNITSGVGPQSFNAYSSMAALTGKFYAEVLVNTGGVADMIGVCPSTLNAASARFDGVTGGVGYASDGKKYVPGGSSAYGATYTSGDTIGIALDMGAQTVTFYKNNTSQGVISSAFTANVAYYFATADADGSVGINQSFNFGQRPFTYTPPSGYVALNTFNL